MAILKGPAGSSRFNPVVSDPSSPPNEAPKPSPQNLRKWGRVNCQSVKCSLGAVLDLSAKGMRVATRQSVPTGTMIVVTIETLDGPLMLPCFAPWRKRTGLFSYEVGLSFVDLKPHAMEALNRLARAAAYNETILPEIEKFRRTG